MRAWLSLKDEPSEREAKHEQKLASVPQVMQPVLLHSLLTGAMSFFLFSFQVHEKTILLPLMPLTLLLSAAPLDSSVFKFGALVNNVGIFRYVSEAPSVSSYPRKWAYISIACGPCYGEMDRLFPTLL